MSMSYIHRGSIEKALWEDVFALPADEDGPCLAINGPNNVGKTSMMKELIRQFNEKTHENVYCFYTSLYGCKSIISFWSSLFLEMRNQLTEQALRKAPRADNEQIDNLLKALKYCSEFDPTADSLSKFNVRYSQIFPQLRKIGIKIILIIDEFDLADENYTLCPKGDGDFFGKLFNLAPKGISINTHSVILVCRRHVSTIEHDMAGGSHLADAYDTYVLRGFSNIEMDEYFRSFEGLPCGMPDTEMVRDIIYYCGRNPGLLTRMRDKLRYDSSKCIARIFTQNQTDFTSSYDRMIDLMRKEYINKDLSCFSAFLENFIGPVTVDDYEVHKRRMDRLYSRGFVTEAVTNKGIAPVASWLPNGLSMTNLFAIAGLEEDRGDEFYEPLSLHFVQYVKNDYLPSDESNLTRLLVHAELRCRQGILLYYSRLFGDDWESTIDGTIIEESEKLALKRVFLKSLKRQIEANNGGMRGITGSILDVLSFSEYYTIIQRSNLLTFVRFLSNPQKDMAFLSDCRNLHAHKNMNVLDQEHCNRLRRICEALLKGITSSLEELQQLSEADFDELRDQILHPGETPRREAERVPAEDPTDLEHSIVCIESTEFKPVRRNLVGLISGTSFKVSVPAIVFDARDESASKYAGITVRVKLLKWENNPASPHFIATLDLEADSLPQLAPNSSPLNGQSQLANSLVGKIVTMEQIEYRQLRGNLSGSMQGTGLRISIPARELSRRCESPESYVGKTIKVRIVEWSNNPSNPHFVAELI